MQPFTAAYPLTMAAAAPVTGHALFPVMSAVGSLNTAGVLVARRKSHRQPHIMEIMQLCRVAMESAALTIWLLSDPDPDVRRVRCLEVEMEQLRHQKQFLVIDAENEAGRGDRYTPQLRAMNAEHRTKFNGVFDAAKEAYSFAKPPSFTDMTRSSARWIDTHVPAHDAGEIATAGMEGIARSFYCYGSSFVHGYQWMTGYAQGGTVFALVSDALAVALNMTECAACLFEAASRRPGGARSDGSYLPERFESTVAAWSKELFSA